MKMEQPDLAIRHLRDSEQIRKAYLELHASILQTRIFIADCLKQHGKHAETSELIRQIRADLLTELDAVNPDSFQRLSKALDVLEGLAESSTELMEKPAGN